MIFLTVDAIRISMDMIVYRPLRVENDQPCIHCKNRDCGYSPRRLPPGLLKYRNRWLGCLLQPCVNTDEEESVGPRRKCHQEGHFVGYSNCIPLLALGLIGGWALMIIVIYNQIN